MKNIIAGITEILTLIGQFARKLRTGMASRRAVAAVLTVLYVGSLAAPGAALAGTLPEDARSTTVTEHSMTDNETLTENIGTVGTSSFTITGNGYNGDIIIESLLICG